MSYYELFDRCNKSELYQLVRSNGHVVLPDTSKDELIKILIGEAQAPQGVVHDIDQTRLAIMRFIIDHRQKLETQITCPAKSFKEDACFGCVDPQVISCLTGNSTDNQRLILLHKKRI